jgi:hypothetical protein
MREHCILPVVGRKRLPVTRLSLVTHQRGLCLAGESRPRFYRGSPFRRGIHAA